MSDQRSPKDLIKSAERRRKATRINLAGSFRAQIEQLEIELTDLREAERDRAPSRRMTDAPAIELANRIQGLREQMADYWLDLVLEQQPWHKWRAFKANNPPRETDEYDKVVGVDFDKLVEEFMPQCVVEPDLDKEDWEGIFEKAAPGDLRDLGGVCYDLHETGSQIPLSRPASALIRLSGGDSEPRETGESPSDATTDGNQLNDMTFTTQTELSPDPSPSPENQSGTSSSEIEPKP